MSSYPTPMCYTCVHLDAGEDMTCAAYPSGIPVSILESRTDHRQPHTGDHGITYEPDPDAPDTDFTQYGFAEG